MKRDQDHRHKHRRRIERDLDLQHQITKATRGAEEFANDGACNRQDRANFHAGENVGQGARKLDFR